MVDYIKKFTDIIRNDEKTYIEDYKRAVAEVGESSAYYKGKPVTFLYLPMLFDKIDISRFNKLTDTMTSIINKTVEEYRNSESVRDYFDFTPVMKKLVMADPGYNIAVPMARYDIFYHRESGSFQFCEINTDGSSGFNEDTTLRNVMAKSPTFSKMGLKIHGMELFDSWTDCLLENYHKFKGNDDNKLNIAIVDFDGEGVVSEFEEFIKCFEKRGITAFIADPREFEYKDGRLYLNDVVIDLIYRRAVTARICEEAENISDFIDAYIDGAVCVVGGMVSQLAHNKVFFAIIHDDEFNGYLSETEIKFVKAHVPWTAVIDGDNAEYIKINKDEMVLKPLDKYAASGVYMGIDENTESWNDKVNEAVKGGYLVQHFCDVPCDYMPVFTDDTVSYIKHNHLVGLYMYNGRHAGFYVRAGKDNVIASIKDSVTLPSFVVDTI